jgi:hypothetical protein
MTNKEFTIEVLKLVLPFLLAWHMPQPKYMTRKAADAEESKPDQSAGKDSK